MTKTNKSMYFQYRCYNDHPFIKERAEQLFEEFQASRDRKVRDKNDQAAYRKAFKTALAGLYLGDAGDDDGSFVRISLNNNIYYGKSQLSPVFQSKLLNVFKWLIDNNKLVCVAESYLNSETGRQVPRGYRLSDDWMVGVENHKALSKEIKLQTVRSDKASFIELRDEKKRCLRLKQNTQKKFSLDLLTWYDMELKNHTFKIGNRDIPPFHMSLTRIYSRSSYRLGGRFYSLFQGFRSQTRLHLKIDGENVFEVDLSSLHPTYLYRMAGMPMENDPYAIDGYPRAVVKVAMQVLLNTTKPFPPYKSLRYFLNKVKRQKNKKNDPDWRDNKFTDVYCKALAQAIADHNKPIAGFFSQGIGLDLQHKDSIFTSCVLRAAQDSSPPIVVLPIHDSYVVKQSQLKDLLDAIGFAESALTKLYNWKPEGPTIKIERFEIDDLPTYKAICNKYSIPVSSSIKEETLTNELEELMEDDELEQGLEDAYDLDAGLEDDNN